MEDRIRIKLINKAEELVKISNGRMPKFNEMNNEDLINFIRLMNIYFKSK